MKLLTVRTVLYWLLALVGAARFPPFLDAWTGAVLHSDQAYSSWLTAPTHSVLVCPVPLLTAQFHKIFALGCAFCVTYITLVWAVNCVFWKLDDLLFSSLARRAAKEVPHGDPSL